MLWPVVLPFKITICCLVVLVAIVTAAAPALNWQRGKTFLIATILACVAFVPLCTGIMRLVDTQRFGVFHYDVITDVNDFRIERYLPTNARDITLEKHAAGHRAKYSISESELMEYLDSLWSEYGEHSAISRDELGDGTPVGASQFDYKYGDLGWPPLENAVEYHSPVQGDGGGATYYFDRDAGTAYHLAGYW